MKHPEHSQQPSSVSRRAAVKLGALGVAAATVAGLEIAAWTPERLAHATPPALPAIQFDITDYLAPARTIEQISFRFPPVYTLFLTAQLSRTPSKSDQQQFLKALETIEAVYPFRPDGVFTYVSYGLPYFYRLPSHLLQKYLPRLHMDTTRFALEEAVPGPTDVTSTNPKITKKSFQLPVKIEKNDVLITLRSDSLQHLTDIVLWLKEGGKLHGHDVPPHNFNGLFNFTSTRLMFTQQGLPRKIATQARLPFASSINPQSPMWMGFSDQQVKGVGQATATTFQGSAHFTTVTDEHAYFSNGSIQHLSHVILDLEQFYAKSEPYTERVQYMFRSNPIPSVGDKDQFTNGGGPSFFENIYHGSQDAENNARAVSTYGKEHRLGHLSALQRSSRAADGTPLHIRVDGPGLDALDVPDASQQPKLHFSIFVPTAAFFATMRQHQASLDLAKAHQVADEDNGIERFLTATRRQNFLVPPRIHRAFPLLEFT